MSNESSVGDPNAADPRALSLDELRARRAAMQHEDDVVSYARRVAQARMDLVTTELARRSEHGDVGEEIKDVLAHHLTGGPARPPRPAEDLSDNALALELDAICAEHGYGRLTELNEGQLAELSVAIGEFERRVSQDRRARFDRLDALSAELVRRYRDGEATVDSLLND